MAVLPRLFSRGLNSYALIKLLGSILIYSTTLA